jgi:DNA-binding transcriptional MerR regulator
MTNTYSISDLAKEFDVTTRTIRHYEDEGLLTPQREGINRLFSHHDRMRLKLALRAKRLGFSLAEIRELFNLYDMARQEKGGLQQFLAKLEHHRAWLEHQREDVEIMLNEIIFFQRQCQKLLAEQVDSHKQPSVA